MCDLIPFHVSFNIMVKFDSDVYLERSKVFFDSPAYIFQYYSKPRFGCVSGKNVRHLISFHTSFNDTVSLDLISTCIWKDRGLFYFPSDTFNITAKLDLDVCSERMCAI